MKTNLSPRSDCHGSILMIGLLIATIIGVVLGSYLYLIRAQNISVVRGQAWNAAMAVAEAGIEEGLAQINPGPLQPVVLNANGWAQSGTIYSVPRRYLTNSGVMSGSYDVWFAGSSSVPPTITSTGTVTVPITGDTVLRIVQITTTRNPVFNSAVVVKSNFNFNGHPTINSYDSSDPNHSVNGQWSPSNDSSNGNVAAMYGTVDLSNGEIDGSLYVGANVNVTPGGTVTGGVNNDLNIDVPDVKVPFTSASAPLSKTVGGTNYDYVMGTGNYMISGNTVSGAKVTVNAGATATLYVTGTATFGSVYLQPGATLIVYVGGPSADINGVNSGGNPYNFQLWGLPTMTDLTLNGNGSFVGFIYAPSVSLKLNGGGSDHLDIMGAIVVNKFTSDGHFDIHYDENLARQLPQAGYVVTGWKELSQEL